jgi:hypothetical protein
MQLHYFGIGPNSLLANRSQYRLKTTDAYAFAAYRPSSWLTVDGRAGRLDQPTLSSSAGPFNPDYPDARFTFALDPALGLAKQPSFFHGQLGATVDTRDHPGRPVSGGLYRASVTVFSDRDLGGYSFREYELHALQMIPVLRDVWRVAVRGWGVLTDTGPGQQVPVYMLPALGGSSTLRAFPNYRFHDRHLLFASVESRWALMTHVDVAAFVDAGSVASRAGDLDLGTRSYGAGLRLHTHSATTARVDVAHGREGWQLLFRLNDPLRLSRLSRKAPAVPFVP